MTSPLWQRSDGELLKALREQAGLDRVVLARMGTMTVHQLRGLEEGEGGEFYSPEIKAHMGRTLLAKLGHVAPAAPSAPEAPSAPALAAAPGEPAVPPQPEPVIAAATGSPAREPLPDAMPAAPAMRKSAASGRIAAIALGLAALTLGAWALVGPRPPALVVTTAVDASPRVAPGPAEAAPAAAQAAPAAAVAVPAAMAPVAVPVTAAVVTTAASPAPTPAPASATPPAADTACLAEPGTSAVAYTPTEPRKAGNFVYLVADRPARLCVVDAARKATRLDLEAGGGRSVYGAAPFVVQGDLGHLRIFFQGVRVQGEMGAGTRVVLNEAPVR